MSMVYRLRTKILSAILLCFGAIGSFAQCNNIEAEAKVVKAVNESSISIEFKNFNKENFKVSLFGPNRKNEINVEKTTFENLVEGKYLIVIVAKREEDNYCPKSIHVTIN